jgi:hypothetical protein
MEFSAEPLIADLSRRMKQPVNIPPLEQESTAKKY